MRTYVKKAYEKCLFILNNGHSYEFYTSIDRKPTVIGLPPENNDDARDYYIENGLKYMTDEDFAELWQLIRRDNKPYGCGSLVEKRHECKEKINYYKSIAQKMRAGSQFVSKRTQGRGKNKQVIQETVTMKDVQRLIRENEWELTEYVEGIEELVKMGLPEGYRRSAELTFDEQKEVEENKKEQKAGKAERTGRLYRDIVGGAFVIVVNNEKKHHTDGVYVLPKGATFEYQRDDEWIAVTVIRRGDRLELFRRGSSDDYEAFWTDGREIVRNLRLDGDEACLF